MKLHKADITKPAPKISNAPPDILCNEELKKKMDQLMKKMDIRVVNMTYYYKNKVKLMSDISKERLHNNKRGGQINDFSRTAPPDLGTY